VQRLRPSISCFIPNVKDTARSQSPLLSKFQPRLFYPSLKSSATDIESRKLQYPSIHQINSTFSFNVSVSHTLIHASKAHSPNKTHQNRLHPTVPSPHRKVILYCPAKFQPITSKPPPRLFKTAQQSKSSRQPRYQTEITNKTSVNANCRM
jgi:hypothetical protein